MKVFNKYGATPFTVGETRTKDEIEEANVWQRLSETKIFQFNTAIKGIQFSPIAPHSFVALSALTAPWVDGKSHAQLFAFAKTKAPFSAVSFRKDGILIALGREDGTVDIYPTKDHQTLLCRYKLRSGVIFGLNFSPFSNSVVAGCGNGTIQIVDVAKQKETLVIEAHKDAVTSICPLDSGNMWVSSSLDGTIAVWDLNNGSEVNRIEAPGPVSRMVLRGHRVFAACGESLFAADVRGGIAVVGSFTLHNRPIVGLCVVRRNIVTASADRSVKVVDAASFNVLHTMKMHSDIAAFDALPDASSYAVALSGGVVQLRYLKATKEEKKVVQTTARVPANFRVFAQQRSEQQPRWNQRLAKYDFADALDLSLKEEPAVAVGMIDELDRLGGLEAAIAGRDAGGVQPLLSFLVENIANPVWSHVLLKAAVVFVRLYRPVIGEVPAVGQMFDTLSERIRSELELQRRAAALVGKIDMLLSK